MSKFFIFIGGIVTGVVLTILFFGFIAANNKNYEISMFETLGDEIKNDNAFKVFQVVGKDKALVRGNYADNRRDNYFISGTIYLLTNNEGKYYYDDEVIKVPAEKEVRQVGIFKYETKNGFGKTVPIIQIMDKQ